MGVRMKYIKVCCSCGGKTQEKTVLSVRDNIEVDEINKITNKIFMQYKNRYNNIIVNSAIKNKAHPEARWIYINEQEYQSKY